MCVCPFFSHRLYMNVNVESFYKISYYKYNFCQVWRFMEKQVSCLAAYGIWGEIRTKGKFKVPMKLKFVQYFFGCIAKIT